VTGAIFGRTGLSMIRRLSAITGHLVSRRGCPESCRLDCDNKENWLDERLRIGLASRANRRTRTNAAPDGALTVALRRGPSVSNALASVKWTCASSTMANTPSITQQWEFTRSIYWSQWSLSRQTAGECGQEKVSRSTATLLAKVFPLHRSRPILRPLPRPSTWGAVRHVSVRQRFCLSLNRS
jgi:hypothetical protein